MKTLLILAAVLGFAIPLTAGCSRTVAQDETTTRHLNGDVSHNETKVTHNDLTGSTSVEKEQTRD